MKLSEDESMTATQAPEQVVAHEADWIWKGTVPSLNGLRALSIMIVLISHALLQLRIPESYFPFSGATGVDVFFVISGFLITLLLIREDTKSGSVSLKRFYLRRAWRIFPAYFFFLGVVAVLAYLHVLSVEPKEIVAAATYTSNIFNWASWDVRHCWSLCVEEHFYLMWPFIFVHCGRTLAFRVAAVYALLTPVVRALLWYFFREHVELWNFTFTRIDTIAIGCCLAFAATSPRVYSRIYLPPTIANTAIVCCGVFLAASNYIMQEFGTRNVLVKFYFAFVSNTVNAPVIALLVWASVCNYKGAFGKFLNSRTLVAIGTLSYSIYLWQQPFFNPHSHEWFRTFPINICLLAVAALGSYYLIEKPFLALKDKLH